MDKKFFNITLFLLLTTLVASCSYIENISKTGISVVVFLIILIIAAIIYFFSKKARTK